MTTRRIVMITTGGTAASRSTDRGVVPVIGGADLVPDSIPGDVVVSVVDLMSLDSSAMSVRDQFTVVAAIADALGDPGVTGVVVTHGTDTLEETAYLADVFATDPRPVVFTGAQRSSDHPEADGPMNIAESIVLAADPDSRGRGVLICLGGRILGARGAFKVSTESLQVFDTVHPRLPRPVIGEPVPGGHPARVDLLALYPGVSPGTIAAAVAQRAAGIVLSATGSGNTHPDITAQVSLATQAVPVVVSSRVPYGPVTPTYGGGGGGVDLQRAGAIFSPWLRASQARMALIALLSVGATGREITDFFAASNATTGD